MLKTSRLFISAVVSVGIVTISSPSLSQKIEYEDGVRIVHNEKPLWGNNPRVALEFVRQIGVFEGPDDNYMFYVPSDIAKDADGNIYVMDAGNYRVQKFDPYMKYLATFGRQGQGPSEFSSHPMDINIDSERNIYVGSNDGRQIQILTPEGKEIKRIRFSGKSNTFRLSGSGLIIRPYYSSIWYVDGKPTMYEPKMHTKLVGLYDENGMLIRELGKIHDFKDINITISANRNYIEVDSHDNIYLTFLYQNRIEKYSPEGKLLWKADRPLNYKLSYKLEEISRELPDGSIMKDYIPRFTSVSSEIGIDHKGRIWVKTITKHGGEGKKYEYKLEIFDNEGILLGRVPLPEKSRGSMRIFHDRLFFIGAELMYIYEYKIIDK